MKQSKLIIIVIILLIIGGWGLALFGSNDNENDVHDAHIESAEMYMERELYQKAILEYEAAIEIFSSEEIWNSMLNAYQKRYEESKKIYDGYLNAAKKAVSMYPNNKNYLITLVELYKVDSDYRDAYKALEKAIESGNTDDEIKRLLKEVKYSYKENWVTYAGFRLENNGMYAVDANGRWTYIDEAGKESSIADLHMASSVGEESIRVIYDGVQGQLIDEDEVVQGKLKFEPKDAGVYSEGLVAISDGSSFSYYDSLGDKQFGEYEKAGTFVDGQAAVQGSNGWYLIDNQGKKLENVTYDEIVLHGDLSHKKHGVMIAKKGNSYQLYKDGKALEGQYEAVDIITQDQIVAACKSGKWGFINLEGKWLINPTFIEAKSFSNGLAAVYNGEKWGFIDLEGELVIDYTFKNADYFNSKGACMIEIKEDTWRMICLYIN